MKYMKNSYIHVYVLSVYISVLVLIIQIITNAIRCHLRLTVKYTTRLAQTLMRKRLRQAQCSAKLRRVSVCQKMQHSKEKIGLHLYLKLIKFSTTFRQNFWVKCRHCQGVSQIPLPQALFQHLSGSFQRKITDHD